MRIESVVCHLSESKAVVKVNGWLNEKNIGSAHAEGSTVELAEDKAILRLEKRINSLNNYQNNIDKKVESDLEKELKVELPMNKIIDNVNIQQEPNDWSAELASIDSEILRLKWSRDDENKFIEKNFGYSSRNNFTSYSELLIYLSQLKNIHNNNVNNSYTDNINSIILESDNLLKDLGWDNRKGRDFLQKEFNVLSRKELDKSQLISFVDKLKILKNNI